MSDSNDFTSNVFNNTDQHKAPRYVRAHMPGMRIAFETGKTQTKRSEDVDIAVKRRKFNAWKAGAKKFSWDLFAIPEDLVDSLKGGLKRAAPNIFHRHASLIVKNNRWKYIHAMTLWSLLPEEYKSEWKAAAELGRVQETSKPVPSRAEVPNFKDTDHFQNGACTYLTFPAAPELSASRVVDTGKGNQSGSYRDSFPASQHRSCDTPNGAILPTDKLIYSGDDNWRPFDPLFDLLDFDNGFMPVRQSICPEPNLQKSSPSYVPNFDFGLISDFEVDNLILSRGSISPPTSGDLDEQRPAKRRRQNPKESREFSDYFPIHNSKLWAPPNGLDNFFGPQNPPFPSITPKLQDLMTQMPIDTYPHTLSTVGRESKQEVCNLQGAGSSLRPRTPAEATKSSASLLSYASASRGAYGQECMGGYHIGASIYWEHSNMPPSNFTHTIGQSDGNNAVPLKSDLIPDILSTLTPQPMTEYLTNSLLQTQESSTYEFPGGFGF